MSTQKLQVDERVRRRKSNPFDGSRRTGRVTAIDPAGRVTIALDGGLVLGGFGRCPCDEVFATVAKALNEWEVTR